MTGLLQVRYAYKGFDVPLERLGVKDAADERRIKQALARHLTVPMDWLNSFVLQRDREGNVLLRETAFD
jgi:hypothetical protein